MSRKRPSPQAVVDLTLSSDDDDSLKPEALPKASKNVKTEPLDRKPTAKKAKSIVVKKEKNASGSMKIPCPECTYLNYSELNFCEMCDKSIKGIKPVLIGNTLSFGTPSSIAKKDDSDNEIEILKEDDVVPLVAAEATKRSISTEDDDLELVGTRNECILPHNRCDCPKNEFLVFSPGDGYATKTEKKLQNQNYCDKCYCYVCDCLASECKNWIESDHCNATDKIYSWVRKRQEKKGNQGPAQALYRSSNSDSDSDSYTYSDSYNDSYSDIFMPSLSSLTSKWRCKCGFETRSFAKYRCGKCGRLCRENTDRTDSLDYQRVPNDFYFGERIIAFRIHAPDVRSMSKYENEWQAADNRSPEWRYDESEMEEDAFEHYLGKRPTLSKIMSLVSKKEKGEIENKEKECIILEEENDLFLLYFLSIATEVGKGNYKIPRGNGTKRIHGDNMVRGTIEAVWNKQERNGVRLFLPKTLCSTGNSNITFSPGTSGLFGYKTHILLGLWFGYFPLALGDLRGNLEMQEDYPNDYSHNETEEEKNKKRTMVEEWARFHNEKVELFRKGLSLTSSTGHSDVGGTCGNDQSLKGILQRYFQDASPAISEWRLKWSSIFKGDIMSCSNYDTDDMFFTLNCRDLNLASQQMKKPRELESTNSVMEHIENLGHESFPFVDGLNIELLDFQKQALQWCLERERVKGGIQSFFWSKLPQQEGVPEFYYNPILKRFRREAPRIVRGGFIADEMGLGKTVISLALILINCPPLSPVSGSPIASLSEAPDSQDDSVSWDKSLYERTTKGEENEDNSKRGSIISRGTLVICPVSLVGQWIEEAKSKLKDPGLVYPYHGQNRIRDPDILSKNAIVVTTYQVLASDDYYHRSKSDSSYCPPCETVRWWRIICDEGHHLRESNTKRNRAITNLVADHKWLVSGTPVNTSLKDLKNQMKFIGIEGVESYFSNFYKRNHGKKTESNFGPLVFMLRNIMMRHTQKQTYRNTKTTLMSLPKMTERSIEIDLDSEKEKNLYKSLDKDARDFYINFKRANVSDISMHYLKLSQKLTPMRVACAGGPYPLICDDDDDEEEEGGVEDNGKQKRRKKKKDVPYSSVAFQSKFKVLISELIRCRDEDASSKSLVFSQFKSTLNWLQNELPKHGFQFRTLSGDMSMKARAKALSDFQKDPPTTIFLLSMRAGNCGINLTQANRVFLMEPNFNPALEKQAIGRVHRLGQKREVEVIRLFVKDTVEMRIKQFLQMKYSSKPVVAKSEEGVEQELDQVELAMPIGNVANDRPKNKILTKEFDLLFGVESEEEEEEEVIPGPFAGVDTCMPDAAPSSGDISSTKKEMI